MTINEGLDTSPVDNAIRKETTMLSKTAWQRIAMSLRGHVQMTPQVIATITKTVKEDVFLHEASMLSRELQEESPGRSMSTIQELVDIDFELNCKQLKVFLEEGLF